MKVLGYLRISTDQQDLEAQRHALLHFAQRQQWLIGEFVEATASSSRSLKQRKINVLLERLGAGDKLLVTELSRLGRNMLETLQLIEQLKGQGVDTVFVRQPELSTDAPHAQLLLAVYGHFAEAERAYVSMRTKQGLAAARARGQQLGRPKGSRNRKGRVLDPHREEIAHYRGLGLSISAIAKLINAKLERPASYQTFQHYIQQMG